MSLPLLRHICRGAVGLGERLHREVRAARDIPRRERGVVLRPARAVDGELEIDKPVPRIARRGGDADRLRGKTDNRRAERQAYEAKLRPAPDKSPQFFTLHSSLSFPHADSTRHPPHGEKRVACSITPTSVGGIGKRLY